MGKGFLGSLQCPLWGTQSSRLPDEALPPTPAPGSPLGYEQSVSDAWRTRTLFLQSHSRPGVPLSRKAGTFTDDNPGEETRA